MLLGIGALLARFGSWPTTPDALVRPIVVVVAMAVASLLIARLVTSGWIKGSLLSTAFVLFTLGELVPGIVLLAAGAWWNGVSHLRRVRGRAPLETGVAHLTLHTNGVFSVVYFAIMAIGAWGALAQPDLAADTGLVAADGRGGPNIYLILLDGYPRADTLLDEFGFDNSDFIESLGTAGFAIGNESRSNYNKTWQTLASALNGRYLDELLDHRQIPADSPTQTRWLHSLIDRAGMLDVLRERGYRIQTLPPPVNSVALTSADDVLVDGHLTDFESRLIYQSPWMILVDEPATEYLLEEQHDWIIGNLDRTVAVARSVEETPTFLLTHVHAPHAPFVLSNEPTFEPSMPECFPAECSLWNVTVEDLEIDLSDLRSRFVQQVEALNDAILSTVAGIVEADDDAVVILMSDHGSRFSHSKRDEHYRTFFAARTPGKTDVFPDDVSPVNVLRHTYNSYFDMELEPLPYRAWDVDWHFNLVLTPREAT